MIDVRVRVYEIAGSNAECVEACGDRFRIVASVDDDRFAGGSVGEDRARSGQRSDGEVFDDQGIRHPKSL